MLSDAYLHEGYIILAIDYFTVHINVSYLTYRKNFNSIVKQLTSVTQDVEASVVSDLKFSLLYHLPCASCETYFTLTLFIESVKY